MHDGFRKYGLKPYRDEMFLQKIGITFDGVLFENYFCTELRNNGNEGLMPEETIIIGDENTLMGFYVGWYERGELISPAQLVKCSTNRQYRRN